MCKFQTNKVYVKDKKKHKQTNKIDWTISGHYDLLPGYVLMSQYD